MLENPRLTTVIERDGQIYVALCPQLNIASQGETIEIAKANLAEAISLFFECAEETEVRRRLKHNLTLQRLILASSNPHKVDEVRAILEPAGFAVIGLDELDVELVPEEPEETGATFAENARLKAVYYATALGEPCLADDSGLEVDALGGAPGILSARYSDAEADFAYAGSDSAKTRMSRAERDQANNRKLLTAMKDVPDAKRTARFVCAMCLAAPDGTIIAETRGEFPGVIAREPRGSNGFGYDPLLYLPERGCTSAELSAEEKNARSHRGEAARQVAALLSRRHS